jgi:hypothetical protein
MGKLVPDERLLPSGHTPAEVVRLIYRWYGEEQLSILQLVARLNALGIPTGIALGNQSPGRWPATTTQMPWQGSAVSKLLRNPAYRGEYTFGRRGKTDRQVCVEVPALVTPAEWHAARAQATRASTMSGRHRHREYLLAGLVDCAGCGSNAYSYTSDSHGREYYYYKCNRSQRRLDCRAPGAQCERVDAAARALFAQFAELTPAQIDATVQAYLPTAPVPDPEARKPFKQAQMDREYVSFRGYEESLVESLARLIVVAPKHDNSYDYYVVASRLLAQAHGVDFEVLLRKLFNAAGPGEVRREFLNALDAARYAAGRKPLGPVARQKTQDLADEQFDTLHSTRKVSVRDLLDMFARWKEAAG